MIGIVDYGRGNLRSVEKALEKLGFEAGILRSPDELKKTDGLILPGVGAFADAMEALNREGWVQPLRDYAGSGRPFLGICLGMQLLFEMGEEHGEHPGLGLLPGRVVKFPAGLKIPHMGWNTLRLVRESPLTAGIPDNSYFYFVHSYYAQADEDCIAGVSEYGITFPAFTGRDNIWGAQFHPEKSSPWGLVMLKNFGKWVGEHEHISGN
ncbi:imidazole glycerol phosphate synthase subunit hisH [Syntrophobotulus glycolicus DSM 8271]|uniref:Imidazole glycerol phosphate synthase subunit HisH n=1 Tax=Syntrophobotulus glycolicus (strain DSM 8271 / FlGlyR) TaxID=645991 RepID=F0T0L1_SYNGF|nr:imidazole glycerol phosphate synthase subunit HisH [Syntrophobotulus glycolicus]ADY55076.1 imidazole glycerol phosphate synthase subunit hisH [Syntrophobotulus glycolicus DSM 8271]